jgi:3-polyprenyl-4-hydroxybenzoate decarboxylase
MNIGYRIIFGVTGGIAAYKTPGIVSALVNHKKYEVRAVMTEGAKHFITEMSLATQSEKPVITWLWDELLGDVTHIEVGKWCDMIVICPASADIIGKIAHGIADDALSTIVLAVPRDRKKMIFPAMNTNMYDNDAVRDNLNILRKRGWMIIEPDEGLLACGDIGRGKLPKTEVIADSILEELEALYRPLDRMPRIDDIPVENRFGFKRKYDVHTGMDLFAPEGAPVYAMERGKVVAVQWFTGEKVGMPWWENTQRILVECPSGVIAYCEVEPLVEEGAEIDRGTMIAKVKRVLRKDKGKPMSMLHLEYYSSGYNRMWEKWELDGEKPEDLRPTSLLINRIDRRILK